MNKTTKLIIISLIMTICFCDANDHMNSALYYMYHNAAGRFVAPLFKTTWFNTIIGRYADTSLSRMHLKPFIKKYKIDLSKSEQSISQYKSFNDFFTRKFPPNSRPIDSDHNTIIAPCDGHLYIVDNLSPATTFLVKDVPFNLEKFLQNKELADYFTGGTMFVIYLAPWHYHRFHFPIDCIPQAPVRIHGKYDSVHEAVYKAGIQPLLKNERQLWILNANNHDIIAFIPVGALCVGKIKQTGNPGQFYKKGDEAGYFAFGGSTIVLLFKKDSCILEKKFKTNTKPYTEIRMGERIATKAF